MYRFFVNKKEKDYFVLSKETLDHINVIRLKKEEKFICIYEKDFYVCLLEQNRAKIIEKLDENHEYKHKIILFAALINIKRFEWLVQKATELGVTEFYPLISKNTNPSYKEQVIKKNNRYNEIIKNSCEQSFRNDLMIFHAPIDFDNAINIDIENKFIAHEKNELECSNLNFKGDVAFFVGPEGGFTDEEIKTAQTKKIKTVSLGRRILRSETASIFLLSNIDLEN